MEIEECTDVQKIYHEPTQKRVQVLKRLDLVNVNLLHCKVALDYASAYCGFDGGYFYAYGERALKHNEVQELDGDLCHDIHGGEEIEVTVEDKPIKVRLQGGKTQETYFLKAKGLRTPNAGCEGVDFTFNQVTYHNQIMTVQVKVSISKEAGRYNPEDELMVVPEKIILNPFEMSKTKRSRPVFENYIKWGTFLVPVDDLPRTECQLVENIFYGNASVFEPHKNLETKKEEPTILIVRDDGTYREISMSLREPQTICKRSMMVTNQTNLFIRMLEEHEEPLSDEIRVARLEDMSEVEILATHITSSSVDDLLSLDNSMSQVSLALCNVKRTQQLQAMASMDEGSIHFGEASLGFLAKKTGAVVRLYQGTPMQSRLRANVNGSCHRDIPIELKSPTGEVMNLFADPLILVIQQTSPPIICSSTPAMFQTKKNKGDQHGTWFCTTDKGPNPYQPPLKLTPHTGMGLSWLSLSIYDHKTICELHHFQSTATLQEAHHAKTIISQIRETENPTCLNGVTH